MWAATANATKKRTMMMGVNRMIEIYLRRADEDVRWRQIQTDTGKRLAKGIRVNCIARLNESQL